MQAWHLRPLSSLFYHILCGAENPEDEHYNRYSFHVLSSLSFFYAKIQHFFVTCKKERRKINDVWPLNFQRVASPISTCWLCRKNVLCLRFQRVGWELGLLGIFRWPRLFRFSFLWQICSLCDMWLCDIKHLRTWTCSRSSGFKLSCTEIGWLP